MGLDAFKEKIGLTDEGMIKYLETEEEAIKSGGRSNATYSKYAKSIQSAGAAMDFAAIKAGLLNIALNTGVMLIASLAIEGALKLFDSLITTTEEYKEKVEESSTAYENSKSQLETVNQELNEQTKVIDSLLSKGNLTYTEEGQLEKLQGITQELRLQQDLLKKQTESDKKDLAVNAADLTNSQYDLEDVSESKVNEYVNFANASGNNAILLSDQNNISSMLAGYKEIISLKDKALSSSNTEDYQFYTDMNEDVSSSLWGTASNLQTQQSNMQDYYDTILEAESAGETLTSDQQKVKTSYEQISDAIKLVYSQLQPDDWNDMKISNLLSTSDIELTKEQLIELAKEGKLDTDTIAGYKNLNKEIENSNLILADGVNSTQAFVNGIYDLADSTEEQTVSLYSLATAADTATGYINDLGENVDISNLQKAIGNSQTTIEDFKSVLSGMDDYNGLTSEGLNTLTQKYPEYLAYIGDEDELRKQLQKGIDEQYTAQEDYYHDITDLDTNYYNTFLENNSGLVNDLNDYYGIDLSNYKSLAQAKYQVDTTLLASLNQKWADYYKAKALATEVKDIAADNKAKYENSGQGFLYDTLLSDFDKTANADAEKKAQEAKAAAEKESEKYKQAQNLFENVEYAPLDLSDINTSGKTAGNSTSGNDTKNVAKFSEQIDYFVEKEKVLENAIESLNNKLSNTTSVKSQIDVLSQLNDKQTQLTSTYQKASGTYSKQYDKALKNKNLTSTDIKNIKNGSYSIEQFNGTGKDSKNEKRYNAIQDAIELRDKISETNSSIADSTSQLKEYAAQLADIRWDFAQKAIDELNTKYDLFDKQLNNAKSAKDKNKILQDQLSIQEKITSEMQKTVNLNKADLDSTSSSLLTALSNNGYTAEHLNKFKSKISNNKEINLTGLTGNDLELAIQYNAQLAEWIENNNTLQQQKEDEKTFNSQVNQDTYSNNVSVVDNAVNDIENSKQDIQNSISEITATEGKATKEQYENLINLNEQEISYYENKKSLAEEALKSQDLSEEQIAQYKQDLQDAENAISDCKQENNEWYQSMLEMPLETLEEANNQLQDTLDNLNDLKDKYDSVISAVTASIDDKIESIQEAQSEEQDYYDSLIENANEELEALQKTNDERQKAYELQQAQYELEKAQNQKTNRVYREGQGFVYEADTDAINEAQDKLDTLAYDAIINTKEEEIDALEDSKEEALNSYDEQIEKLETIKEQWENIASSITEAANIDLADNLLGDDWEDDIQNGDTSYIDDMQNWYQNVSDKISDIEDEVKNNEEKIKSINNYVEAWKSAKLDITAAYNDIQAVVGDNAVELETTEARTTTTATYGDEWSTTQGKVETAFTNLGLTQTTAKDNEALVLLESITNLQTYAANVELILNGLSTTAAAVIDNLSAKLSEIKSLVSKIDSYSSSSNTFSVATSVITGTLMAAGKSHEGMELGYISKDMSSSTVTDAFRMLALDKLDSDEIPRILKTNEAVLTPEQVDSIMANVRNTYNSGIGTGSSSVLNNIIPNDKLNQISYSIGEIHLHEIQNVDKLSKAIKTTFLPTLNQQLYK